MGLKAYENKEFIHSPEARTIRILSEYFYPIATFEKNDIHDAVVLYGSARIKDRATVEEQIRQATQEKDTTRIKHLEKQLELSRYYYEATKLSKLITLWGKEISKMGEKRLVVCTGGGPGIMEAGNKGAIEAEGVSISLNISLPFEQHVNPFATPELSIEFHYFFMRKFWFLNLSRALIAFPGGFGTLDEIFETLTLVQTGKNSERLPIILYGTDFWKKLINFDFLLENGLISAEDLEIIEFADTPEQALAILKKRLVI